MGSRNSRCGVAVRLARRILVWLAVVGWLLVATAGILLLPQGVFIWQDERLLHSLPTTRAAVEKHLVYTNAREFEPDDASVWKLKEGETGVQYSFLWSESIRVVYTRDGWVRVASYWD